MNFQTIHLNDIEPALVVLTIGKKETFLSIRHQSSILHVGHLQMKL